MNPEKPRGETDHCRNRLIKYCNGQGVDLGCGSVPLKVDAISVDLYSPYANMNMDVRLMPFFPDESFDYVYSSHLLEEIEDTESTLKEWLRILKPGGYLVLYQADRDYYYPLGDPRCNPNHKHHFIWEDLWNILQKTENIDLIHHKRYGADVSEWSFELVIKKRRNMNSDINFKIMVIGGPAENYIERCLTSIKNQDYENWTTQVILDPVLDCTFEKAKKFESDKIKIKLNTIRVYNIVNFLEAAKLLNPSDNNVMVMIDADDWLAESNSLSIVKKYYENNPDLLVTHGSWKPFPNPNITNNRAYTEFEFKEGIRKFTWRASHLRTCKYKVWKYLKEKDLKDENGNFFTVAGDLALMYPLLEMAGFKRVQYIPEILYIYNQETPFNDEKQKLSEQRLITKYIQNLQPYSILE